MPERAIAIAIDGPAASGKGTLARALAAALGLRYLDTGTLYRAAALRLLAAGGDPADAARSISDDDLADPRLRDADVTKWASKVAAIPAVRAALLDRQRAFAATPPGAVLDGRDIGTVVLPGADVKLFLVADRATRARRRHAELAARGSSVTLDEVRADLDERDRRDAGRDAAPLRRAEDAIELDTTAMTPEAMLAAALAIARARMGSQGTSCDSGPTRL